MFQRPILYALTQLPYVMIWNSFRISQDSSHQNRNSHLKFELLMTWKINWRVKIEHRSTMNKYLCYSQIWVGRYDSPSSVLSTFPRQVPTKSACLPFESLNKATILWILNTGGITIDIFNNLKLKFFPGILQRIKEKIELEYLNRSCTELHKTKSSTRLVNITMQIVQHKYDIEFPLETLLLIHLT
jgi:hypothetical protein